MEADITGGSTISSQAQPKQEASTASSKNHTFKKGITLKAFLTLILVLTFGCENILFLTDYFVVSAGDRVKYVGSLPSGFSPTQTPIR